MSKDTVDLFMTKLQPLVAEHQIYSSSKYVQRIQQVNI